MTLKLYLSTDSGIASRLHRSEDVDAKLNARLQMPSSGPIQSREGLIERLEADANTVPYSIDGNGNATVMVEGDILGHVPWDYALFGDKGTNTYELVRVVAELGLNTDVKQITLAVDSPGGTLDGLTEVAETIRAVRGSKPVVTVVRSVAASAAYWIGSQATEVRVSKTSMTGSIGAFIAILDVSEALNSMGVKVHKIATSDIKGTGLFGTELTDEQRAYLQSRVDKGLSMFKADVAEGRGLSMRKVDALATGGTFYGEEAVSNGLADTLLSGNAMANATTNNNQTRTEDNMAGKVNNKTTSQASTPETNVDETTNTTDTNTTGDTGGDTTMNGVRVDMLLEKYAAKVMPAKTEKYHSMGMALARDNKLGEFEAFLRELPDVNVKSDPEPVSMNDNSETATDERATFAAACGITVETLNTYGKVAAYTPGYRKAYDAQGTLLTGVVKPIEGVEERLTAQGYTPRKGSAAVAQIKTRV